MSAPIFHTVESRPACRHLGPIHTKVLALLGAVMVLLCSSLTAQALELAAPFADGAVLQRDMNVPVWGWADAGAKVTVSIAGQTKTTTAGKDGKWRVDLEPLTASFDPAALQVSDSTGKSLTVNNVLVGEVWMASGQSNMQWIAEKCDVGTMFYPKIKARVEAGEIRQPVVREAKVTDYYAALHPVEHATAVWSDDAANFSGIAAAFAFTLAMELDVPVGILNCSFSQTAIQAWVPRVGFRDGEDDYTKAIYQKILETDPNTPEHKAAWTKFYTDIQETIAANKQRAASGEAPQAISTRTPGNLDGNRDATWLYNARIHPVVPYAIRGAIWNQGYANMNEGLPYYNNLHSMVRGWRLVWNRSDLPVIFHQFYTPGGAPEGNYPSIGSTSEMRLGTWLARDIPNTAMASQIDIGGSIHYRNKALPGQRMALQALRNQYADQPLKSGGKGKDTIADGPMFKSYSVEGDKLIVQFEHADGGLVVGLPEEKNMAIATVIPNGEDQVKLFYLADENRIWYPATFKIDGDKVIISSPKVKNPRGVSYASAGVSFQPNLYNKALLPATPFIYFDNQLVLSKNWPDEKLKVDGVTIDPSTIGLAYDYRKMPLLSTQFRENAVFQADMPLTIWGAGVHPYVIYGAKDYRTKGKAVVHFNFAGVEKQIPITDDMIEWQVTIPPMPASDQPQTLTVKFTIDGELVHERIVKGIIFGDVYYVAAPAYALDGTVTESGQIVRMMANNSKRSGSGSPSRFSVSVSTGADNRFGSTWDPATGFAAALGHRIAAKTKRPVGIIFMQTKSEKGKGDTTDLKSWIPAEWLKHAPSLMEDYKQLASVNPGNEYYDANALRYVNAWKAFWSDYIPQLMKTGKVPDGAAWGHYPSLRGEVKTDASHAFNAMVCSFTPASLKGIVFLTGKAMVEADGGEHFAEQLTALANSYKTLFACPDPMFIYTLPSAELAPKITKPASIQGASAAVPITQWPDPKKSDPAQIAALVDAIVNHLVP